MLILSASGLANADQPYHPAPANTNASTATRALLTYLYEVRDRDMVLSGQHAYIWQDHNEIEHVKALTGKYPAILEFDLLDFNRTSAQKEHYLNFAKDWHQAGGLISISWHETNPILPTLDEGGYSEGTKMKMSQEQFDEMLTPGTELHQNWLAHLDLAADWLSELQDEGVVVLWRPYHEMTGGWFWWGDKEPESFCRLWQLSFERLTKHHQLNNLI